MKATASDVLRSMSTVKGDWHDMTANKTIVKIAHTDYVVAMKQVIGAVTRHTFTGYGIDAADVPVWWSNGSTFVRPGYFVIDANGYAYRVPAALVRNI